jgi:hypothetical protein
VEVRDQNKGRIKTYAGLRMESNQPEIIHVNFAE